MSSKLSLSKIKAAKKESSSTPGSVSRASVVLFKRQPDAGLAKPAPSAGRLSHLSGGQQQQPASRSSHNDDSDWDSSDAEPAAAEAPPGAAAALGTGDSQVAARAPSCGAVLANWDLLQSRRCELYSSDEDGEELPDAQEQAEQAGSQPQLHTSSPPRPVLQQQPVNFQQPQHRKRSFDRETEQPAGAVGAPFKTAAATAAAPTPSTAPQPPAGAGSLGSKPLPLPTASSLPQGAPDDNSEDSPEYDAVKAWLQGLQLGQYCSIFVREEIDMSVVHALTAEDLSSIGITHRSHQQAIIAAGHKVAAARQAAQRGVALPTGGGNDSAGRQPAFPASRAVPQQQLLPGARTPWGPVQQAAGVGAGRAAPAQKGRSSHQSLLQVWQANAAAAQAAAVANSNQRVPANPQQPPLQQQQQQQQGDCSTEEGSLTDTGTRPKERALLAQLYPTAVPAAGASGQHLTMSAAPAPVQLRPSTVCGGAARVPLGASLWAAAGECRSVGPSLEQRLAKRREEAGLDASPQEKLARGGTAYPQVDESRALKLIKLQALRQELAAHQETVAELTKLVRGMEHELGLPME